MGCQQWFSILRAAHLRIFESHYLTCKTQFNYQSITDPGFAAVSTNTKKLIINILHSIIFSRMQRLYIHQAQPYTVNSYTYIRQPHSKCTATCKQGSMQTSYSISKMDVIKRNTLSKCISTIRKSATIHIIQLLRNQHSGLI